MHPLARHLRTALLVVSLLCTSLAFGLSARQALAADATREVLTEGLNFNPVFLEVPAGTTVVWRNATGPSHRIVEQSQRFGSPLLSQGITFSQLFTNAGVYPYFCEIHPGPMRGEIRVVNAVAPVPQLQVPAPGAQLPAMGTQLRWANPASARQVHLQVIPANNDGPGVDVLLGLATQLEVPAPPAWYGLLPGMTYRWRVRTSDQELPIGAEHPTWGTWGEATFRTPGADSGTITAVAPAPGGGAASLTPTLTWANSRGDVYYYEVQLSRDAGFNTDAGTAIAAVYGALIHGGVSTPANSYTIPASAPLDSGATYFWRVRPRVQGDGQPVAFSPNFSFRTP